MQCSSSLSLPVLRARPARAERAAPRRRRVSRPRGRTGPERAAGKSTCLDPSPTSVGRDAARVRRRVDGDRGDAQCEGSVRAFDVEASAARARGTRGDSDSGDGTGSEGGVSRFGLGSLLEGGGRLRRLAHNVRLARLGGGVALRESDAGQGTARVARRDLHRVSDVFFIFPSPSPESCFQPPPSFPPPPVSPPSGTRSASSSPLLP